MTPEALSCLRRYIDDAIIKIKKSQSYLKEEMLPSLEEAQVFCLLLQYMEDSQLREKLYSHVVDVYKKSESSPLFKTATVGTVEPFIESTTKESA